MSEIFVDLIMLCTRKCEISIERDSHKMLLLKTKIAETNS